jgi:hypothetical protein
MKISRNIIRALFPKTYIKFGIQSCKKRFEKVPDGREAFNYELLDYEEWLREIEDKELIKKAEKMDIYLDEIPYEEYDPKDPHDIKNSHFYYGTFGSKMLGHNTRKSLIKKVRERVPSYRKERREFFIELSGILIGVIGALSGLVAVLSKTKDCL